MRERHEMIGTGKVGDCVECGKASRRRCRQCRAYLCGNMQRDYLDAGCAMPHRRAQRRGVPCPSVPLATLARLRPDVGW